MNATNQTPSPAPIPSVGRFELLRFELARGLRKPHFPTDLTPRRDGLVAKGGKLSTEMLLEAYSKGYFPWSGKHPIPWYCPDPRLVLFPHRLHISKSLKKFIHKKLKRKALKVHFDRQFHKVITACATTPRKHEEGTWITENMRKAYAELHQHNVAHSVEVYYEKQMVGGLYGLTLGRAFFGESMFSQKPNASKVALVALCEYLQTQHFDFIDCQVPTSHLMGMGASSISRESYLNLLADTLKHPSHHKPWSFNLWP